MPDKVTESKMNRFRVGDIVSWEDNTEFPPIQYEGEVTGFANKEGTYLTVELSKVGDEKGKSFSKELTEDEIKRVA